MATRNFGHYEIQEKLGQGGMGEVYRALDSRLDRPVALKLLPPEFTRDPERVARFRREAKLLGALQHPNVAAIFGLEEEHGELALAMELVEGEDLSARLLRGPLPLDDLLDLARQFTEGLEAAHERGIVHRDLKPANIKLSADGQLKILDFGLARAYVDEPSDAENLHESPTITAALTQGGVILGTAAYMSPEQARGKRIDQRADIWAFGVILFEMLTGKRLFEGETISDLVAAVLRAEIDFGRLPDGTPRGIVRLLERCLERDPRKRLRDIGEARVRLERWREQPETIHESYGVVETALPRERSWAALLPWAIAALALGLCVFLLLRPKEIPEIEVTTFDVEIDLPGEEAIPLDSRQNVWISPNGRWIAWTTPNAMHVRANDSREVRTLDGTANIEAACFSPDSRWIAFVALGRLQRISISGGAPFAICDMEVTRGCAWVDDNTIVVSPSISSGLVAVDVATGAIRPLTEVDSSASERSHRWPTAVPGKRAVLFEAQFLSRDYDQSDVRYVELDGGHQHTVHAGGAAAVALASGCLIFGRGHTLFAARLDLDRMELTGLPLPVLDFVAGSTGDQEDEDGSMEFSIDRHGNLLYITDPTGERPPSQLTFADFETNQLTPIGRRGRYGDIEIAPDGKSTVIETFSDSNWDLMILDLETANESLLTHRRRVEYSGCWSPDSRDFYWTQASEDASRFEIWTRPVDGSGPPEFVVTLPHEGSGEANDVSPDGRTLLCDSFSGRTLGDLYSVDLTKDPREARPYVTDSDHQAMATFVGDGSYVVFGSSPDGSGGAAKLFVRRFPDDGSTWSIPEIEGGFEWVDWFPSRSSIFTGNKELVFEFPLEFTGGSVRVGERRAVAPQLFRSLASRILNGDFLPDGEGALVALAPERDSEAEQASVALITGWEQSVLRRLAEQER